MRIALAAALVVAASLAAPAAASEPGPLDGSCGYMSTRDPRPESSYDGQVGYLYSTPIWQDGTVTCTIKSGFLATHADAYELGTSVSATGTLGVTVLPPTPVAFVAHPWLTVLCTQFTDSADVTWYLDGSTGEWTTDPDVGCDLAISASTEDPFLDPFWDMLKTLGEMLDDAVATGVEPAVCPALAALPPGTPPLVDVRSDGDTYVAGDLVLDCPPESAEPGEEAGVRPLPERFTSGPARVAGAIRVSDTGAGPSWSVTGTLVSVDWDCSLSGASVVCDWDGYWAEPGCHEASATAAALAPTTRARTRVSCVRGTTVESTTTGVASAALPATYAERATTRLPVTSLRCDVDDGAGGPPVAPYVATCGFGFGA